MERTPSGPSTPPAEAQPFGQAALAAAHGELAHVGVQVVLVGVHQAVDVVHQAAVGAYAQAAQQACAADAHRAGAADDDLQVLDALVHQLQGVDQGGRHDHGRAVQVLVEDGDGERGAQGVVDLQAVRGLDVLQVDGAEGRLQLLDGGHEPLHVAGIELEVEHVDVGEALEQDGHALLHGLGGEGADVAEAGHGGAVGEQPHQVAACRIAERLLRIRRDGFCGEGRARQVGHAEVARREARLGGVDGDLAGTALGVIVERVLFADHIRLQSAGGSGRDRTGDSGLASSRVRRGSR
jgi:hypothetical protein